MDAPFQTLDVETDGDLAPKVYIGLFTASPAGAVAVPMPTALGAGGGLKVDVESMPAGGAGLTDGELRASAVPVSYAALLTELQAKADLTETQPTSLATLPTSGGKTITYVSVNQSIAGTTELAAASASNKHKLMGGLLIMSLAGSLKFTDGVADLTGPMDTAANGGFMASPGMVPLQQTGAINRALNLVTTVGAARGCVAILTEP